MRLDLLYLSRSIRRSPASAIAAVLTLALTVGAGASIFAVVDAVLLTPPPFADPGALVLLGEAPLDDAGAAPRAARYATFEAWRERAGPMASIEAFDGTNLTLTGAGAAAERLTANDVTSGFFPLLGVAPAMGRGFHADDFGRPVAIVSAAFWRSKLGADPAVIGRAIMLGGRAHTIVGVLPERFTFAINPGDIWRPIPIDLAQARRGYPLFAIARLARGTSPASLAAALGDISRASSPPSRVVATPIGIAIAGSSRRTLGILGGAAALALLIAVTNLAGLLIVRSIDRRRELAVRAALGARRSGIARQLFLEAAVLVAAGSAAGVLVALWMTPAVARLALEQFGAAAGSDVVVSWRVIAAVTAAGLTCAAICAAIAFAGTARSSVVDVLRRGVTPSPRDLRLRRVFVAGEVALAFVLLVSMALVGRTLIGMLRANPGFDTGGVLILKLSLPGAVYPTPQRVAAFYADLQGALEQRLGPRTVSVVDEPPLTHDRGRSVVSLRRGEQGPEAVVRTVAPGYFEVMRISVAAGRSFEAGDDAAAPARVVISQSLAGRLFASEPPAGRQVWLAAGAQMAEVVGVVGDVRHRALDEVPVGTVYLSAMQSPSPTSVVVARSARPDSTVVDTVRAEVARLDANLPVYGIQTMQEIAARSPGLPARRLLTAAFTAFALLALVLSAIGLFGVAAHDVASRRTELALRIALGADRNRILRATLGRGAWMVGCGLAAGGVLSIWAARALSGLVFTTEPSDFLSIAAAAVVLMAAGAAAVLPAALRAARTDPLIALRSE